VAGLVSLAATGIYAHHFNLWLYAGVTFTYFEARNNNINNNNNNRMVDYSRFDHIDSDSENENEMKVRRDATRAIANLGTSSPGLAKQIAKKGKEGRIRFEHDGRTVYEWEQSLTEVNIYIEPPPGLPRKMIDIKISHRHLTVGVLNTPPFIDEDTGGPLKAEESLWTLVDGELMISLQKMNKAEAWDCALRGPSGEVLDDFTKEETRKKLMLERFQEEVGR